MFLFYFFKIFILFYFILAASGLSCSTQDLSLWRGLLSSCGAQAPGHVGSVVCGMQALSSFSELGLFFLVEIGRAHV